MMIRRLRWDVIQNVFTAFDADENGFLDQNELQRFVVAAGTRSSDAAQHVEYGMRRLGKVCPPGKGIDMVRFTEFLDYDFEHGSKLSCGFLRKLFQRTLGGHRQSLGTAVHRKVAMKRDSSPRHSAVDW